nr:zinc finger, CCHC-type [Tanacetum cinerariifolium]
MKNQDEKGIDCIFIRYAENSRCYRFYVIEPNDFVSMNSIIESRDAIFDEVRFTSIPRPIGMIQPSLSKIAEDEVEGTDDVPGPSVPRKSTRIRKAKCFGSDFQLYLVKGTRDKTLSQREYCFIIEEDPRTLSEAMASLDVTFWKEAVQSEIDSIMHNDTWELTDFAFWMQSIRITDQDQVNKNKEFLSSKFDMKDLGEAELEYSRAIRCLMYAMISTRPDIAFAVEKLTGWSAVENDKGLLLLRVIKTYDKESSPNEEYDVKESVSNKDTFRKRDLGPIIDLMRGVKSEPGLDVEMDLRSELWMINIPKKN